MQKFEVSIEMGNSAMSEPEHVAQALFDIAAKLHAGQTQGTILDENGNSVGNFVMDHPDMCPDCRRGVIVAGIGCDECGLSWDDLTAAAAWSAR